VVDADGSLVAVNEAAGSLFSQGLGLWPAAASAPPAARLGDGLAADRATRRAAGGASGGGISLFGLPPFEADGSAAPRATGRCRPSASTGSASAAPTNRGLTLLVGLGRMLAHGSEPAGRHRGAAQLLKSGPRPRTPLAQLIVDETDRVRRLVDRMRPSDDALPSLSPSASTRSGPHGRWRPAVSPTAWG
jgi:two-component system nitrogen regulation sensor histidine kinase GlnL